MGASEGANLGTFDKERPMPSRVLATTTASITELKRDPMGTVAAGEGAAVAILNRNQPAFYCVPAAEYEAIVGDQRGPRVIRPVLPPEERRAMLREMQARVAALPDTGLKADKAFYDELSGDK
jgi:hypothetical protein